MEIIKSKSQLKLYGYKKLFSLFVNLNKERKLPNVILLNGMKGIGKATFAYHFINYLLSLDENEKYLLSNFEISNNNASYKLLNNNTHPNFFLLEENSNSKDIKIEKVRSLISFLSKSSFLKDIKIVLIDDLEFLNLNSSNALLKALEEPSINTFFFLIHDNSSPISETIKSRSSLFNINFSVSKKKEIFSKIAINYELNLSDDILDSFLYFDTPGNLLLHRLILSDADKDISNDLLSSIFYLIEKCKNSKKNDLLSFISLYIQSFYNKKSLQNNNNLHFNFTNKYKIMKLINNMKRFNLDKRNMLMTINNILLNEPK